MGLDLLLTSYRAIIKNPRGSITNITALSIGIASALFVTNLLLYEMSYDHHMDDVFRVEKRADDNPGSLDAYTSSQIGPNLVEQITSIQAFARLIPFSEYKSATLRYLSDSSNHPAYFKRAYYADPEVIDFFNLELLVGRSEDFGASGSLMISQKAALELFGPDWKTKSLGTEFRQGRGSIQHPYHLIGIFADRKDNTHMDFDALIAMATPGSGGGIMSGYTYVSGVDIDSAVPLDTLYLRPASATHTAQGVSNEAEPVANSNLLLLLSIVAIIILLITVTNYVNSTIIHFVDRCKDIGIRKLHGASIGNLTLRLGGELLSINLIATLVGLGSFIFCVYMVNRHNMLTYPPLDQIQWTRLVLLQAITIITNTMLSAIYPFFFLSRIEIVSALKGAGSLLRTQAFGHAGNVVRALLVFQIVTSIVFLSASLIIYRQLQLIDTHPKGEVRITGVFPGLSGANPRFTQIAVGFLDEMVTFGTVVNYSFSNMHKGNIKSEQKITLNDSTQGYLTVVDPDYWTESKNRIKGEIFNPVFGQNPGQVILDSAIAQARFGYDDSIKVWQIEGGSYETIGIFQSKQGEVERAFVSGFRYLTYIDLVLNYQGRGGDRLDQFLEKTEYIISTRFPFFFLLRREQEASGEAEEEVLALFVFFGGVSVLVAVIGLFGLSYFVTKRKSREVGIRKIHGASSVQILTGLLTDFARLVLLGGLLAAPITYFGGRYWLENYVRRIDIDVTIFLLPLTVISFISLLTVLDKSWKAATLNPIDILDGNR
ncbi:MAG: hypothetical protein JXQ90_19020 [Cyclobacteriaceae bacterium]